MYTLGRFARVLSNVKQTPDYSSCVNKPPQHPGLSFLAVIRLSYGKYFLKKGWIIVMALFGGVGGWLRRQFGGGSKT